MKRLALLFLLILTFPAVSQQVIRPTTCDYRYHEDTLPGRPDVTFTNWIFDIHYANLPQGRTYRRQVSEDGFWRYEGAVIVVPEIPDATASYTEGIDIRPIPPPIHFFRLVMETNVAPPVMKRQMELVMAEATPVKTWYGKNKKKITKPIVIKVPPNGVLTFTPKKQKR